MIMLLEKILKLNESLIDFAQPDLDLDVWVKSTDGQYTLKPDVEHLIMQVIKSYPSKDLISEIDNLHIIGSITTNQYLEDSDIDVHIFPKNINIWNEDKVWEVKEWFDENAERLGAYVKKHPIEIFIQIHPAVDYLSPGFYDITNHKWVKGPKIVSRDYDPYEDFSDLADDLRHSVKDADLLMGELKRDIIDFETIQVAVNKMSLEDRKKFLTKLENKLQEIETDIATLSQHKDNWVAHRRLISDPASPEQALKDIELAKQWRDANALFKLIGRYQYITIIKALKEVLWDDGEVTPEEVEKIKDIMGMK